MSEKDKHIRIIKPLLDKWNADFDQMEAKIRKCGADSMLDFDEVRIALRQCR
jgi:hypothetical protein